MAVRQYGMWQYGMWQYGSPHVFWREDCCADGAVVGHGVGSCRTWSPRYLGCFEATCSMGASMLLPVPYNKLQPHTCEVASCLDLGLGEDGDGIGELSVSPQHVGGAYVI